MSRTLLLFLWMTLLLVSAPRLAPAQEVSSEGTPNLVLQIGHVGDITSVVFSPDGQMLASVSIDHTLKLWDGKTGVLRHSLTGHIAPTLAAAFAPNSKTVYSISRNGPTRIWDTRTGTLLGIIRGPEPGATAMALWCGGAKGAPLLIAAAYPDKTIKLWKAQSEQAGITEPIAELKGHLAVVRALAFSPDGRLLASGDNGGNLKTWDTEDGALQRTLHSHAMSIRSLAFSADSKLLADASDDGSTERWEMTTGKELGELQLGRPGDGEGAVAFSPDGQFLATGGYGIRRSENLKLWNARTAKETLTLRGHEGFVSAAAFSPDGRLLATGGYDTTVRLWDLQTGKEVGTSGRRDFIDSVVFSPTGDLLASGSADGLVRLWNMHTGELKQTLAGHKGAVRSVAFTPNGKFLASGGRDGQVIVWNPQSGLRYRTFPAPQTTINALAFSPDGKQIAIGSGYDFVDGAVTVREVESGNILKTLDSQSLAPVRALAYSPDGNLIATASESNGGGEMRFWEAETGKLLRKEFTHGLHSLAFTPDGKTLVFGGSLQDDPDGMTGGEITFWNARTQAVQKTTQLSVLNGRANALAYLPDKQHLIVGGSDGRLLRVNANKDEIPQVLFHSDGAILSIALSPNGKLLAVTGLHNTIRLWGVEQETTLATLIPLPVPPSALPDTPARAATISLHVDTDWLAITPDGYYDGSAGAGRLIKWRINRNLFPVEAFESVLRRPQQVRAALDSGNVHPAVVTPGVTTLPAPASPTPSLNTLIPPQITFNTPLEGQPVSSATMKVKISVTDVHKVSHVEVLANGRPAGAKPIELGAKPIELGAKPIELGAKPIPPEHKFRQEFQIELPLPPGESHITLTALVTDDQGLQAREEIHLTCGAASRAPGNLYVLAVGVSHYQNPKYNLKYAASDAAAFVDLWRRQSGALYQEVKATQLIDGQATGAAIRAAFLKLREQVTERDSVAIFLSGHGVQATEDEYFFAAQDIDATSIDRVRETGLPWTDLQTTLALLRAKRVLLFLDACHSGNALGGQQSSSERMAELLVKQAGVMVFASCRSSEYSYELDTAKHGAFTTALIEGLGEGKADMEIGGQKSGVITAEALLAYLRARVPQLTGNLQTPTCPLLRDFGGDSPLATAK